ncbi:DASH family cryptochrome [Pseudoalteromonas luteoviolacea]|uniref:DASH family cryptochrome n=1 Tax=Pseudoalteromonas luteoviolacea TaxID=43657 RepID=UPI0011529057|nr:DASH family cryptochrome [Pseudoalteromonas luteoviolacea]TQF70601.1 DASH family cryptochrome [Pseudoalteromonas luteoviolacea]
MKTALYWFTEDLRLHDNVALNSTLYACDEIIFVYVLDEYLLKPTNYNHVHVGDIRLKFIKESLADLSDQLQQLGYELQVFRGETNTVLKNLVTTNDVDIIGCHHSVGLYERRNLSILQSQLPDKRFICQNNNLLFGSKQVEPNVLNGSFSKFRKKTAQTAVYEPVESVLTDTFPRPLSYEGERLEHWRYYLESNSSKGRSVFCGGERKALLEVESYFNTDAALSYKQTRNELEGHTNSTKFSPYLALGNISPREIVANLKRFEHQHGANDSTYWIFFEILWREFFHHKAILKGSKLFEFSGESGKRPLTTYYPQRFLSWCNGETSYPLVNALMKELNATGFMSNRGRQIVASCLVNELQVDWRYGAAFFQQQLVDYDVASNWGNWQYIAGVGDDPKGGRHFNINKQAEMYDPNGAFVRKWSPNKSVWISETDIADWPQEV